MKSVWLVPSNEAQATSVLLALVFVASCTGHSHYLQREPASGRPLWMNDPTMDSACTTLVQAVASSDVIVDVEQARGDALRSAQSLVVQRLALLPQAEQKKLKGYRQDYFHEGKNGEAERLNPKRVYVRVSACADEGFPSTLIDGTEVELPTPKSGPDEL